MHRRKHISRGHPPLGDVTADTENTSSSIVACWTVFTEPLPGNVFIKSITILCRKRMNWNRKEGTKIYNHNELFPIRNGIAILTSLPDALASACRTGVAYGGTNRPNTIHFIPQWLYSPLLGPGLFFSFVIILTQSVGRLGRGISPSKGRYLHTGQDKTHTQTFTPWVGFESTISAFRRAKTVHALNRATTVIKCLILYSSFLQITGVA
jgi:hypothetical protein